MEPKNIPPTCNQHKNSLRSIARSVFFVLNLQNTVCFTLTESISSD